MSQRLALGLAAAAVVSVSAVTIPRDASTPGVVSFPLRQVERSVPLLNKRATDTDVPIYNISSTSYLIELSLGTPGQTVQVALDTGSSELWVNPDCTTSGSTSQAQLCQKAGSYDPNKSSTSTVTTNVSSITYGKGEVELQYVSDNITFPGSSISLSAVTFGYATASQDLAMGIMGTSFGKGTNMKYNNVIDEMVDEKVINSRVYGVALGAKTESSNSGLITFGGVDTKKYSGALHNSPVLGPQNGEDLLRFWIQLDSVGLKGKTYANSQFPVFFDTGSTLSYLPASVMKNLVSDLSGQLDPGSGVYYIVPCGQKGSLSFTFGNFSVSVDLAEFIWDLGDNTCVLGAAAADDGDYLLGDSFLRSVYAVFDIDTPAVYFAEYVACGTNEQVVPAGANAAAAFVGECTAKKSAATVGVASPVASAMAAVAGLMALMALF